MTKLSRSICSGLATLVLVLAPSPAIVPTAHAELVATFTPLGHLPGGTSSIARAVSDDGSVIVGDADSAIGGQAFRWTASSGIVGLGILPGTTDSAAWGVSADGTIVVGRSGGPLGEDTIRWTAATGLVGLGDGPGPMFGSSATAISADGAVIAGRRGPFGTFPQPYRWTAETGFQNLGILGIAYGMSADGSTIVGVAQTPSGQAFVWKDGSVSILGSFAFSEARDASADGSVVVGHFLTVSGGSLEAFRWSAATGIVRLGDLPGGRISSQAWGVSGDGNVVAGTSITDIGAEAFIWTPTDGMRNLRELLIADFGLAESLSGWLLTHGFAVARDGQTIVGYGMNPNGEVEAWRVQFAESVVIPEPATIEMTVIALALILVGYRHKRTGASPTRTFSGR